MTSCCPAGPRRLTGMRVLFAGTPEVALPALTALMDSPEHEVVGVLTRADARRGRGTSQAGRRPDQGAILPEIPPFPQGPRSHLA